MINKFNSVNFGLQNKNIIITGGSGFLGSQMVSAFVEQGSNVYNLDRKKPKKVNGSNFYNIDITKEKNLIKFLSNFKKKKKRIDVLINNAAIDYLPKKTKKINFKLEQFSEILWDKDLEVGLKGSYLCTKLFGAEMAKQKKGIILNISSDLGIIAPDQRLYKSLNFVKPITYSVVKHGIIGLTKYTAAYWGDRNVRCNALAPGGIFNNQNKKFIKNISKLIPLGRMANKNEYNVLIMFLCSDLSSYITGAVISADGGRTII